MALSILCHKHLKSVTVKYPGEFLGIIYVKQSVRYGLSVGLDALRYTV